MIRTALVRFLKVPQGPGGSRYQPWKCMVLPGAMFPRGGKCVLAQPMRPGPKVTWPEPLADRPK